MDKATYDVLSLMDLPNIRLISLDEFEKDDEALRTAKVNRSLIEYYFTCTPSLPLFIFNNRPGLDRITYLDADLFFFAPPELIFEEMDSDSVLIVEHRFPPRLLHLERTGIYNVGLLSFRSDQSGLRCLRWWRERCLEWCYDRVENGRFADQKYLDDWPTRFSGVKVSQHTGAGLAPWNIEKYTVRIRDGRVMVDDEPLIFVHFQGIKRLNRWIYNSGLASYQVKLPRLAMSTVYAPYVRELRNISRQISSYASENKFPGHSTIHRQIPDASHNTGTFSQLVKIAKGPLRTIRSFLRGDLLLVFSDRME